MRLAETVTFGGSSLDRAAALRGDAAEQARLLARGTVLPLWRGKPLVVGTTGAALGWLPPDHPVLSTATDMAVFLGLDDTVPRFARDISAWVPEPTSVPPVAGSPFFDPQLQTHPELPSDHAFAELRGVMTALTPREAELAATAKAVLQWHTSHRFCSSCGAASVSAMAGWQRDCPACNVHHFPRTDPVVIMLVTRGNSVLLGRSPGWPEGMYSLLAGFVEPGETVEAAVRREVFEEAGIRTGQVRYLASQPWPFPSSLMLGCATEALEDGISLDRNELEDALWLTREEMIAVMAGQHPRIRSPRKGAIAHFLVANWLADRLD
jgi:NAD+ diphosphatase